MPVEEIVGGVGRIRGDFGHLTPQKIVLNVVCYHVNFLSSVLLHSFIKTVVLQCFDSILLTIVSGIHKGNVFIQDIV